MSLCVKHGRAPRRAGGLGGGSSAPAWRPSASACSLPAIIGAARPRVVIVGSGPAGVIAARRLVADFPTIDVTLIAADRNYVTPFFSNRYLAGMQDLDATRFDYLALGRIAGLRLIHQRVTAIEGDRRTLRLADGGDLEYDRLIVAPGVSLMGDAIAGYDEQSETVMPHAYGGTTTAQWQLLRTS